MDLGATVAFDRDLSPLFVPCTKLCVARREGMQAILPTPCAFTVPSRVRNAPSAAYAAILQRADGAVLLGVDRRGYLGRVVAFPQFDAREDAVAWMERHAKRLVAGNSGAAAVLSLIHSLRSHIGTAAGARCAPTAYRCRSRQVLLVRRETTREDRPGQAGSRPDSRPRRRKAWR